MTAWLIRLLMAVVVLAAALPGLGDETDDEKVRERLRLRDRIERLEDEIKEQQADFIARGGRFLVPLPTPRLV